VMIGTKRIEIHTFDEKQNKTSIADDDVSG
jgi:hypothetical protein